MSNASLELGGGNWAAKDGKLLGYAVGDTSGKYIPREFDFTRGGDIAATRVNEDGLIEKYRENLLLQSNNFGTTWSTSIASVTSVTSGESGYDGSGDVWLLSKTGANGYIYQNISQSGVLTYSVYAKAGTTDWIGVLINGSANAYVYFDLGNGVAGTPSQLIDNSIESVGNGWYRCSITFTQGTISRVRFYPAEGDDDAGASSGSIYIQDAQLEQGLVATDYLESGATTGKAGVLADLPRIDYTGGSAQLLMEPLRTNVIEQSEYFGDWSEDGTATVTLNQTTSPEGLTNAALLDYGASAGGPDRISTTATITGSTVYAFSVFAKAKDASKIQLRNFHNASYNAEARFDLDAETVIHLSAGADSGTIEDYGNGWYRCTLIFTSSSVDTEADLRIGAPSSYSDSGEEIYIYGAQLEAGSYATSYIPNYGTALGVTRDAEGEDKESLVTELPSELSGGYTLFMDFEVTANEDPAKNYQDLFNFKFDSSVGKDAFRVETYNSGTPNYEDSIRAFAYKQSSSGAVTSINPGDIPFGSRVKLAATFDDSYGVKIFYNGSKIKDYAEVTAYEKVKFIGGAGSDGNTRSRTLVNQILAYPTVLSETECENLTTI